MPETSEPVKKSLITSFTESCKHTVARIRHNYFSTRKASIKSCAYIATVAVLSILVVGVLFPDLFNFGSKNLESFNPIQKLDGRPIVLSDRSDITMRAEASDSTGVSDSSTFMLFVADGVDAQAVVSNLTIDPPIGFGVDQVDTNHVRIIPETVLGENKVYQFSLADEAVEGSETGGVPLRWAFQTKDTFRVISAIPRHEAYDVPIDTGIEFVLSHENYEDILPFVSVSPEASFRFERHKKTAVLVPDSLEAGTIYTVTLHKDLGVIDSDETLGEDYVIQFETAPAQTAEAMSYHSDTYFDFGRQFVEVAVDEKSAIGVYSYRTDNAEMELDVKVYKFNTYADFTSEIERRSVLPTWARHTWEKYQTDIEGLEQIRTATLPVIRGNYQGYIVFQDLLPEGQYVVVASNGDVTRDVILQVTNLSVYQSTTQTDTLVWIHDLSTQQPASGARVSLSDGTALGTADAQGVVSFATPDRLRNLKEAEYFSIRTDTANIMVPVNQPYIGNYGYYLSGASEYWDWTSGNDTYWEYMYTDRELYRPTDKVNIWGIAKDRDDLSKRVDVTIRLFRSGYYGAGDAAEITQTTVTTNDYGVYQGELSFENITPGFYYITTTTGSNRYITIKDFTKPAYTIDITGDKKAIFVDQKVTFSGKTAFFEGTPVSHVELQYNGVQTGEVTTDAHGTFAVDYTPEYQESADYPIHRYLNAHSKLEEEAEIAGRGSVQIFGSRVMMDTSIQYPQAGSGRISAQVFEVNLDGINAGTTQDYRGGPVRDREVTGAVTEYYWERIEDGSYYDFLSKRTQPRYRYNRIETDLGTFAMRTNANGDANHTIQMKEDRRYKVVLEVRDAAGKVDTSTVYLYDWSSTHYSRNSYASGTYNLQAVTDEAGSSFKLNEPVTVLFKDGVVTMPEDETAPYLFYQAQRGLRKYSVQTGPEFSFAMTDDLAPNVYIFGVYFNGITYEQTASLKIDFDQESKQLDLNVTSGQKTYRPGEQVSLMVNAKKPGGAGVSADVNISVVDEAIFALEEQHVATLDTLYQNVSSGVLYKYATHEYPKDFGVGEMGAACFIKGTLIRTGPDTFTPIEEIRVGDTILTLKNPGLSGLIEDSVVGVDSHTVNHILVINRELWVTPEHRFLINGQWQEIGLANVGDMIMNDSGGEMPIDSIEHKQGTFEVYNLHIAQHKTFIAENYYAHNQKGEGRFRFADTAFFDTVRTNAQGNGFVTFTAPDNITSWRVTYMGVTRDLYANHGTTNFDVSLPVFAEVTLSNEYLIDDAPVIKLRAYGSHLSAGDDVTFSVKIPSLGWDQPLTFAGKAFEETLVSLPALSLGEHMVVVTVTSAAGSDTLTKYFTVVESRLVHQTATYSVLGDDFELPVDQSVTLTFTDGNRGKYYPALQNAGWGYDDRVDQQVSRLVATELLNRYFELDQTLPEFVPGDYQLADGGIALLPYSDSEPALTAHVGALASERFDRDALIGYFNAIVTNYQASLDEVMPALYGLAALDQPVLVHLNLLKENPNLHYLHQLYLGLAYAELGDYESAYALYAEILQEHGEDADPYIRLNVGRDQDDTISATALIAILAAHMNDSRVDGMFRYTDEFRTRESLVGVEKLLAMQLLLPRISGEPVSFTYHLGDVTQTIALERGQSYRLELTPAQTRQISFSDISENVLVTSVWHVPYSPENTKNSEYFEIHREYSVNGNVLKDGDTISRGSLVRVELRYSFTEKAFDGCHQVIEFLPSGLRPIAKLHERMLHTSNVRYPYFVDDNSVRYCLSKDTHPQVVYYARVISPGVYTVEGTLMQSQKVLNEIYLSPETTIRIE